jgi:hypothetical protein
MSSNRHFSKLDLLAIQNPVVAIDLIDLEVDERDIETFEDLVNFASTYPHIRAIYLSVRRFMDIWLNVSPKVYKRCCKVTTDSRSFIQVGNLRVMPRS